MISGKRLEPRYSARETVVTFADDEGDQLDVAERNACDGLAYRYLLAGDRTRTVCSQTATTTFAQDGTADTLGTPMAPNGGFVLVAHPRTSGRANCYDKGQPTAVLEVRATPACAKLEVGSQITVRASAPVASGIGQDLTFAPLVPAGWSMDGAVVTHSTIFEGDQPQGTWTLTVGPQASRGEIPLGVGALFTSGGRQVFAADGVDIFVAPDAPTELAYVSDTAWLESSSGWAAKQRDRSIDETRAGSTARHPSEASAPTRRAGAASGSLVPTPCPARRSASRTR